MTLNNKVAVIYGAGGALGSAIAHAFAREGAKPFRTGWPLPAVEAVARDVVRSGGSAEAAEVDALDELAIERHLQSVVDPAGRIDISFNAVGIPNPKQPPQLVDLYIDQFLLPIAAYTRSNFLTARLAARRMVPNRSGVIMTVTATTSRPGVPLVGGPGPAMAAMEALMRGLSVELAPHGIRVVGLRTTGMPDTARIKEVFRLSATVLGVTAEQFPATIPRRTHTRRLTTLEKLTNVSVFMASDRASAMT